MEYKKYCCEGWNAKMYTPYKPIKRDGIKFYTAVYICNKCHSYTLRGETNQKKSFTTFVEFIDKDKALSFKQRRDNYVVHRNKQNSP